MSLAKYHQKRKFDCTPEPRGQPQHPRGPLRFVIQKHHASRLHYDFRLELDGTLKSWAIPKGPSLKPGDKRLAVMVEDHPLEYRDFEGIIPAGNYGAGSVIVWDEGTYCSRETSDRQESEQILREGLRHGHLTFVLNGHKLKGEFALHKLKHGDDKNWLLLKKHDDWASDQDITDDDRSVASGKTLEEIAAKPPREWHSRKASRKASAAPPPKPVIVSGAPKARMPHHVKPMLATLAAEPFDRPGWFFEVKWDGYRAIAEVNKQGVLLYSRNQKSFDKQFAPIVESLHKLGHEAVFDGEVVVLDERGRSHFQLLQNYQKTGRGALRYCVFDLLHLDGRDLCDLPLKQRKQQLKQVLHGLPNVFLGEHIEENGIAFFAAAQEQGLEGIIAKESASKYLQGFRSQRWLKIKTHKRQEAVIGGFTEPRGSRKDLGALVLGVYQGKDLVYIGHTGGGLADEVRAELRARLQPLVQRACPFHTRPRTNAPVHWVEPRLVCEVSFQEWTQDGIMRMPIFVGLREDKSARLVHREVPQPVEPAPAKASDNKPRKSPPAEAEPPFTNLQKVYWPEEGYTKGDLISYYRAVAPVILPYLRDRPESLHRHPNGINGASFFQKDVSKQPPPPWVTTVPLYSDSNNTDITYLLCQDTKTLLYLANLGGIELNPWNSRVGSLDRPDYLVIDLDPENVPFERVVEAALAVRKTLERVGGTSICKTSGKRGMHVYVPLGARYDNDHGKQFAEIIATVVHHQLPATTSVLRSPAKRQGRVYLDFLQNRRGQTLAAPYSVRPWPGATVSTPLAWKEVTKRLDPTKFTMFTMPKRIDKVGDLWKPVNGPPIDLVECLTRLARP
jgi:bifunctional non-homologous end joining protein LigD